MKNYLNRIRIKENTTTSLIDNTAIEIIKNNVRIPQNGITYDQKNKIAYLLSNNLHDILEISKKGYWDHSLNPTKIEKDWEVYVVPTNKVINEYKKNVIGIKFIAKDKSFKLNESDVWPCHFGI